MASASLDVDGAQGRALSAAIDAHRAQLVDAAEATGAAATPAGASGARAATPATIDVGLIDARTTERRT